MQIQKLRSIIGITVAASSTIIGFSWVHYQTICLQKKLAFPLGIVDLDKPRDKIGSNFATSSDLVQRRALWQLWVSRWRSDPLHCLELAQSKDPQLRLAGVQLLAEHHWSEDEICKLMPMLDTRTLIGLARCKKTDERFFYAQPFKSSSDKPSCYDQLHNLLSKMPLSESDLHARSLAVYALGLKSQIYQQDKVGLWTPDGQELLEAPSVTLLSEDMQFLLATFEALNFLCRDDKQCEKFAECGGLKVLYDTYYELHDNSSVTRAIAFVLSIITTHTSLHKQIVAAGWLPVLRKWLLNPDDFEVSLCACKALTNMDSDDPDHQAVQDVFIYSPNFRVSGPQYADIVFLHGLLGDPFKTWRQRERPTKSMMQSLRDSQFAEKVRKLIRSTVSEEETASAILSVLDNKPPSSCWPRDWLAKDLPNVRIITLFYCTQLSEWFQPITEKQKTIKNMSAELMKKLKEAGLGKRPIVWVGHSLGGLLIKEMLTTDNNDAVENDLAANTKGVIFYSVPHAGSYIANYFQRPKVILNPSVEAMEMRSETAQLKALQEKFRSVVKEHNIPVLSFGEGEKTVLPILGLRATVVPTESSDPGVGEFHLVVDSDHINICKPGSPQSILYFKTLDFISSCINVRLAERILTQTIPEDYVKFPDQHVPF